ncbi:MAG: HU family DNA-binding protein [Nitrospirota bacterium]
MTKEELIDAVQKANSKANLSKENIKKIADSLFLVISKSIKKEKRFNYPGFGTFKVKARKARQGRNPQTGEPIKIKASKTVGFKPAPPLKKGL